jgi:DNA-binding CsgD family transcriptional regulator
MVDPEEKGILEFSNKIADYFNNPKRKKDYSDVNNFPLQKKQAIYILNWSIPAITYSKGIEDLLGYLPDEFDYEKALTFIHPDDLALANRITKATVNHCRQHSNDPKTYLNITYRLRKKDGSYIKVLRQSGLYLADEEGRLVANYSLLTDISFMHSDERVDWEIEAADLDKLAFHTRIYEEFQDFFTRRELELIKLLDQGLASSEIADQLYLSRHTIATHRKNIYRKSNCKSKDELIAFCKKNGIL